MIWTEGGRRDFQSIAPTDGLFHSLQLEKRICVKAQSAKQTNKQRDRRTMEERERRESEEGISQ